MKKGPWPDTVLLAVLAIGVVWAAVMLADFYNSSDEPASNEAGAAGGF